MLRKYHDEVFNTANAALLQRRENETGYEELYMKNTGELFIYSHSMDGDHISVMDEIDMDALVTDFMNEDTFRAVFGNIPDDNSERCVCNFTISRCYSEYIETKAKDLGITVSEMLEKMVNKVHGKLSSHSPVPVVVFYKDRRNFDTEDKEKDASVACHLVFIRKSVYSRILRTTRFRYWDDIIEDIVNRYIVETEVL